VGRPAVIGARPIAPARWLISLVVVVLPPDVRDRYREEFSTELAELGRLSQVTQSGSLLMGSISLRNALTDRDLPELGTARVDWRCRMGRHRFVMLQDDNPEMRGRHYLRCTRCGKPKDPPSYGVMPPTALGAGGA
jgi:hypothetical protein